MKERLEGRKGSRPAPLKWLGWLVRALLGTPARAVRGTARRVADPARQVFDYWASERRTVRQGFAANLVSALTSLLAGLVLASMSERLKEVEGFFILIPVSIGMRGNIFGALSARLGTSIHSGLFEISFDRDKPLFQNIYATALLTVSTSVTMGLLARGIAALLGVHTISVWDFVLVALVGGLLSSTLVLAFTIWLSIKSYQRGWDLDSVGAVLVTAMGDVVTLPCLLLASYLVGIRGLTPTLGGASLALGIGAAIIGLRTGSDAARRIIRESFPILCIAIVLDLLAGTVVQSRIDAIFSTYTAFLIFLPGFLENTGALGSILAARLGTKLHLGAVSPTARPGAPALLDGTIVAVLGIFIYTVSAVTSLLVAQATGDPYPGVLTFLGAAMFGGLMALIVAGAIGYYAAIASFRGGYDPDNQTIPLVTSGMDLLGAICLVIALVVFGVA
jgi:mgtE-like transporter